MTSGDGGAEVGVEVDTVTNPELDPETQERLSRLARKAVNAVMRLEGYKGEDAEVSILYTDDTFIAELNHQYRGVEGPTDVLSFAMMDANDEVDATEVKGLPDVLGDIVVSIETAGRQAKAEGKTLEREITLLLVHGALHLLGYDHDGPEREAVMWRRQDAALKALDLV